MPAILARRGQGFPLCGNRRLIEGRGDEAMEMNRGKVEWSVCACARACICAIYQLHACDFFHVFLNSRALAYTTRCHGSCGVQASKRTRLSMCGSLATAAPSKPPHSKPPLCSAGWHAKSQTATCSRAEHAQTMHAGVVGGDAFIVGLGTIIGVRWGGVWNPRSCSFSGVIK